MEKEKINMLETIFEAREEDLAFIDGSWIKIKPIKLKEELK